MSINDEYAMRGFNSSNNYGYKPEQKPKEEIEFSNLATQVETSIKNAYTTSNSWFFSRKIRKDQNKYNESDFLFRQLNKIAHDSEEKKERDKKYIEYASLRNLLQAYGTVDEGIRTSYLEGQKKLNEFQGITDDVKKEILSKERFPDNFLGLGFTVKVKPNSTGGRKTRRTKRTTGKKTRKAGKTRKTGKKTRKTGKKTRKYKKK